MDYYGKGISAQAIGPDFARQTLGDTDKVAIKETPLTALNRGAKYLQEAVNASRRLREEMCGSWPESDEAAGKLTPSGFFGEVEATGDSISRMAAEILNNLSAIQSRM